MFLILLRSMKYIKVYYYSPETKQNTNINKTKIVENYNSDKIKSRDEN